MKKALALIVFAAGALVVSATPVYAWGNVTICHATASETNPYVKITVAVDSLDNGHGVSGINEGDIVPPFVGQSGPYPGHNWDTDHQAIWDNDCVIELPTTTTTAAPSTTTSFPFPTFPHPTTTTLPTTTTTHPCGVIAEIKEDCPTTTTTTEAPGSSTTSTSAVMAISTAQQQGRLNVSPAANTLPRTGSSTGAKVAFGALILGAGLATRRYWKRSDVRG